MQQMRDETPGEGSSHVLDVLQDDKYQGAACSSIELEVIFHAMADGLIEIDRAGRIVRMNPAARGLIGLDAERDSFSHPLAQRLALLHLCDSQGQPLPEEAWPALRLLRGESLQGHEAMEVRLTTLDGRELDFSVSGMPMADEQGQITGAIMVLRDVTERKRQEEILRASEERGVRGVGIDLTEQKRLEHERTHLQQEARRRANELEALFEAMTEGIFVYDALGRLQRTNAAARALLARYLQAEEISLPVEERVARSAPRAPDGTPLPPEQVPPLCMLRGAVLTGANRADVVVRTFAGEDLWLNMSGTPLRDEQGQITGAVAIARDVTEERLEEQRAQHVLEALLEMAQAMVQGATGDGSQDRPLTEALRPVMQRLAALTRAVVGCQRLGFVRVEPETTRLRPLAVVGLSPEQEQQWWREQEQQDVRLSDGVDHSLLERLRANELLLLDLTHPPYREQPNPYGIRQMLMAPLIFGSQLLGLLMLDYGGLDHSYTDEERTLIRAVCKLAAVVMERERLWQEREEVLAHERALGTAYQRMVQLIELAHDAVIVRDPGNRIQFWNRGAERLYGWTASQARGQVVHVLLPTRFPSSREAVEATLAEAGQWEGLLTHTSRAGKEVIVESRRVLVRGAGGEPEAIVEINRDVTERERILQEREEARANELAANEASRRMDEFIGVASHELKTPLTSIKGNLQLARRRLSTVMGEVHADDERMRRQLEGVQTMLERAERQVGVQNRLVSDLVDVSRIQTGKLELQLAITDLATVVREVVEDHRFATPMRLIVFETSALVVNALADGERIGQVVSNYLANALKYSPEERPVAVRLAVQGELVRVEVADSGPGLSAEQQARIWERFYRVPEIQVQSGTGVGLGLGLHICRMIIEQHHGEVGVQSTPGKGSTFWFTLPRAQGA